MVTQRDIEVSLRDIGLKQGDTVIVHSSLSSFGEVEGGADTVVDAVLEIIGNEGTLVVPTFNFNPGIYNSNDTPSVCGAITETARKRPNALRSNHPTHSVAAIGQLADVITEGHENTEAFARGSALFKVLQAGGKILQLGTTHTTNSMIHVAEELVGVSYLDRTRRIEIKTPTGKTIFKWIRRPGCSYGFDEIDEALSPDAVNEIMIGKCRARLMAARAVVDAAVEMLKFNQEALLCTRPDCESCAEARAMISVTETEKQDNEVIEMAKEEERMRRLVEDRLNSTQGNYMDGDEYQFSNN